MKNERVKKMLADALEKALEKQDLTEDFITKTYKEAIMIAKDDRDASAMIKGADRIKDLMELIEHHKQMQAGIEGGFELSPHSDKELKALEGHEYEEFPQEKVEGEKVSEVSVSQVEDPAEG